MCGELIGEACNYQTLPDVLSIPAYREGPLLLYVKLSFWREEKTPGDCSIGPYFRSTESESQVKALDAIYRVRTLRRDISAHSFVR